MKKTTSLFLVLSIICSFLCVSVNAAEDSGKVVLYDLLCGANAYVQSGTGTLKKGTTVVMNGENITSDDGFYASPYKELRLWSGSALQDYDYLDIDLGIDTSSSYASGDVNVQILSGSGLVKGGSQWKVTNNISVTLSDKNAKHIRIFLGDNDDSLSINLKQGSVRKDADGNDIDAGAVKIGFANAYLSKRPDRGGVYRSASAASAVKVSYDNSIMSVANSASVTINASNYYKEFTMQGIDGTQYSEAEFMLGTASYTESPDAEQYVLFKTFEQTDSPVAMVDKTYAEYYIKLGSEPRRIVMPVAPTAGKIRFNIQQGFMQDGTFVPFSAKESDADDAITYGAKWGITNATVAVLDVGLYKNSKLNAMLYTDFNTLGAVNKTADTWDYSEYWGWDSSADIKYDNILHKGAYISHNRGKLTHSGTETFTYVTEGYIDRLTGYIGVPAGQGGVAADPADAIIIKGYKFALDSDGNKVRHINYKVNNNGVLVEDHGEVLFEEYGMQDGFLKPVDIDLTSYDYIKISAYFKNDNTADYGTIGASAHRHAQFVDMAWHQYKSDDIALGIDKESGIVTASSKTARTAGTLAAVAYNGTNVVGTAMNNTALLGTESVNIAGKGTVTAKVLVHNTLDCSALLENAEKIKYYYVEEAIDSLEDLSVLENAAISGEEWIRILNIKADMFEEAQVSISQEQGSAYVNASASARNITGVDLGYKMIVAFYGEGEQKLVGCNIYNSYADGEMIYAAADVPVPAEAVSAKAMIFADVNNIEAVCSAAECSVIVKEGVTVSYPGYNAKAVTLSFDDNEKRLDVNKQVGELLKKNNLRATFNLTRWYDGTDASAIALYTENEAGNHGMYHTKFTDTKTDGSPYTTDELKGFIKDCQDSIEAVVGIGEVRGFAWPSEVPSSRDDYGTLLAYLEETGHEYAREIAGTKGFDIPADWMKWKNTAKIENFSTYWDNFTSLKTDDLKLLALWGHPYEMTADYQGVTMEDYDTFFAAISGRNDIWCVPNIDVCLYNKAVASLVVDNGSITNNSDEVDVYVVINGEKTVVKAGQSFEF